LRKLSDVTVKHCGALSTAVCAAADSDSAEVTAEVTSPDLETDGVTSQSASDDTEVDKAGDERTEAEGDVSLSVAHSSARTSHDERSVATHCVNPFSPTLFLIVAK